MSKADMFLSLVGQRSGPIKGESEDERHKDEIDIIGWSWGIGARKEMAGGGSAGKATIKELSVLKHVDKASTALMSVITTNELITKAVLAVRKAGTTQQEYFKISIQKGRITSLDVQASGPEMVESVTFAFQAIDVEYRLQGEDGQLRGSQLFSHEID